MHNENLRLFRHDLKLLCYTLPQHYTASAWQNLFKILYSISPPSRSTLPPAAAANFVPAAAAAVEE